jgi:hypothetical protein
MITRAPSAPSLPLFAAVSSLVRLILKIILLAALVLVLVGQMHEYSRLVLPFKECVVADGVEKTLLNLGAPEQRVDLLAEAVRNAARATHLPRDLLIALIFTESTFKEHAVSEKSYKGLMQIPQEIPYADANILVGARILEDKMRLAKGDLRTALAMYKGGKDKPQARRYASHTIGLYMRLKDSK